MFSSSNALSCLPPSALRAVGITTKAGDNFKFTSWLFPNCWLKCQTNSPIEIGLDGIVFCEKTHAETCIWDVTTDTIKKKADSLFQEKWLRKLDFHRLDLLISQNKVTTIKEKSLLKDTWTLCADMQINTLWTEKLSGRGKGHGVSEMFCLL